MNMMESYIMCLYRQAEQYFSKDKSILAKCNVDETDLNSLRGLEEVAATTYFRVFDDLFCK